MVEMAPAAQAQAPPGVVPPSLLLDTPAWGGTPPPPGADTTMTTDGPDQVWFLVVAITCIAIPGLFLIVRIYTKLVIVKSLEVADYFIFLSFPLIVAEVGVMFEMVKWGAGVHQWQITLRQLFKQLYWMNTGEVIYCPLSFLVKISILLQYLRLFAPDRQSNKLMWYGSWAIIVSCFIFYTFFMFWTLFSCQPRELIWNKLLPGGKCQEHGPIVISQAAFNMAADIIILLLPTSTLWKLEIPRARKITITILFATGLLACAASAMRIAFAVKVAPILSMSDVSHNGLFIGLWTEAEVALGFIVACALCLPRLIQAHRDRVKRGVSSLSFPKSSSHMRMTSSKITLINRTQSSTPNRDFERQRTEMSASPAPRHEDSCVQETRIPSPPLKSISDWRKTQETKKPLPSLKSRNDWTPPENPHTETTKYSRSVRSQVPCAHEIARSQSTPEEWSVNRACAHTPRNSEEVTISFHPSLPPPPPMPQPSQMLILDPTTPTQRRGSKDLRVRKMSAKSVNRETYIVTDEETLAISGFKFRNSAVSMDSAAERTVRQTWA